MPLDLRTVNADEAQKILEPEAVKSVLRTAFLGLRNSSAVQPPQTVTEFPNGSGDCIFYPALLADRGLVGVKVSPYIKTPAERHGSVVTAFTLLLSTTTGQPVLLCDSLALTTARTAGTTAIALDYLTPASAHRLAVLGAGKMALEHLRYVMPARTWSSISIFSPTLASADGRSGVAPSRKLDMFGFDVRVACDARDAIADADVVMLCTSSATPVLDVADLRRDAVVTSISTDAPRSHEISPNELPNFAVFCDYRATAPLTAGEMLLAQEMGIWTPDAIIHDLPELIAGTEFALTPTRRYFRSTGLGIEDLAVASLLC
jgi:L-arginine dehydrogenase